MGRFLSDFLGFLFFALALLFAMGAFSSVASAFFSYGWPVAFVGVGQLALSLLFFAVARWLVLEGREKKQ